MSILSILILIQISYHKFVVEKARKDGLGGGDFVNTKVGLMHNDCLITHKTMVQILDRSMQDKIDGDYEIT